MVPAITVDKLVLIILTFFKKFFLFSSFLFHPFPSGLKIIKTKSQITLKTHVLKELLTLY